MNRRNAALRRHLRASLNNCLQRPRVNAATNAERENVATVTTASFSESARSSVSCLSKMKIGLCAYSGYKIYPGHGKTMVKVDGKSFTFLNSKCEAAHLMRRNPRKVTWTVLYRRKHKKGQEEEQAKKRTRRTQKFQRAIVGASLTDILAKRNMKPEIRKAQREQAIKVAKEQKKAAKATKKAAAPPKAKAAPKQKATKVQQKAAPRVGGKR